MIKTKLVNNIRIEMRPEDISAISLSIGDARELKRKELQTLRDTIIASDINNVQVGRQQDRENLEKAISNFDPEATTRTWIMTDNSTAQLTLQQLTDALEGYWYRLEDCFTAYGQAIEDLKLLTTVEDIQNFTCEELTNA